VHAKAHGYQSIYSTSEEAAEVLGGATRCAQVVVRYDVQLVIIAHSICPMPIATRNKNGIVCFKISIVSNIVLICTRESMHASFFGIDRWKWFGGVGSVVGGAASDEVGSGSRAPCRNWSLHVCHVISPNSSAPSMLRRCRRSSLTWWRCRKPRIRRNVSRDLRFRIYSLRSSVMHFVVCSVQSGGNPPL